MLDLQVGFPIGELLRRFFETILQSTCEQEFSPLSLIDNQVETWLYRITRYVYKEAVTDFSKVRHCFVRFFESASSL